MNPHPSGWTTSFLSSEWNPLFLGEDYMCAVAKPIGSLKLVKIFKEIPVAARFFLLAVG